MMDFGFFWTYLPAHTVPEALDADLCECDFRGEYLKRSKKLPNESRDQMSHKTYIIKSISWLCQISMNWQ